MEKELSRILQGIKEKTSILVQAVSVGGEYFASTMPEFIAVDETAVSSNQITQKDGKTFFKFSFGGQFFIAVIDGDGEPEKNYANLITGYVGFSENKPKELSFDEQMGLIITGSFTKSRTMEFMADYSIPKSPVYVSLINSEDGDISDVIEFLSSYYGVNGSAIKLSPSSCALVSYVESSDLIDNLTSVKQAEILAGAVFEELGVTVKVFVGSTVKNFLEVSTSFIQAKYAEKCAEIFADDSGVCAYKDYLLNKIFDDLSDDKIAEYLSSLSLNGVSEIYKDQELMHTGECFLRNNLNVSETAREMYIHRNTLIYRLEKIEKLSGLDIKKFNDALNFKILYILYKSKR